MILSPAALARFWPKIDVGGGTGCWRWTAAQSPEGYGRFYIGRVNGVKTLVSAHRVMWALAHGSWPTLFICHNCQNPNCVNPSHLREDTNLGNMLEAAALERMYSYAQRKLTPEQVHRIRNYPSFRSYEALAEEFNVGAMTVWNARHYHSYKDVP